MASGKARLEDANRGMMVTRKSWDERTGPQNDEDSKDDDLPLAELRHSGEEVK
jgi:hypothetical protein